MIMSVHSDEQARRGFPAQQTFNGHSVTRHPQGGEPSTVTAVWHEYSEDKLSSQRPERSTEEGLRITRHGILLVPVSQTVLDTDQWTVLGEVWVVQRIGAASNGYRELYLQIDNMTRTSKAGKHRVI